MNKGFKPPGGGNIQQLMKQAQKMQQDLAKISEDAHSFKAEGTSGGGMVKVVANGKNLIESVEINPEVVNKDDVAMLQEMVISAANNALTKAQEMTNAAIAKVTAGMPGMGGLPF